VAGALQALSNMDKAMTSAADAIQNLFVLLFIFFSL
jgi:hypothetical protein